MADSKASCDPISRGVVQIDWAAGAGWTASGDVGEAQAAHQYNDKAVQVRGTAGTAWTVVIEGSNFATGPWGTLDSPLGSTLSFNQAKQGVKQILENPVYVRPRLDAETAGAASTIAVRIIARSSLG